MKDRNKNENGYESSIDEIDEEGEVWASLEHYNECPYCKDYLPFEHKFCKKCGNKNNKFSNKAFAQDFPNTTLEEDIKYFCIKYKHTFLLKQYPDEDSLFCYLCGKKLI